MRDNPLMAKGFPQQHKSPNLAFQCNHFAVSGIGTEIKITLKGGPH